ncbi:MAG: hypothetical protein NVSMB47_21930 [Polyangiales bacterium]
MGALRDPGELRDVPAVAVCATCGDPSCPGHDFEASGERPVRRWLAWEDGETPPMRALWRTAMTSASDLDLWVRASSRTDGGIGPAFTFALACESVAVASTTVPLAIGGAILAWSATHSLSAVGVVLALAARVAAVFVPLMLVIHVVYQWSLARAGNRLGTAAPRGAAIRAGLYACGWDLATGPAGVLASLFIGEWREARRRARGNSTLFRDATSAWLLSVHEVDGERAHLARRATRPWMAGLLVGAVLLTAWAFLATLR